LLPILVGSFLLWAIFIWKEWEQKGERRFWVKIVAAFLGLMALALLILKPAVPKKITGGWGIVLTKEYDSEKLDSLKAKYKRIKTETYAPGKTLSLTDQIDSLFVLGQGVQPNDFWQLENKKITFLDADAMPGWTGIHYKKRLAIGDALDVKAVYNQPTSNHQVVLMDNGGNALDSIVFGEDAEQLFAFSTYPKASGRFVYSLVEKDQDGNQVSEEPLPFIVVEKEPMNVLIINDFPTFETKYLKNFLAENGHQVLVRSQLTKNRFKFEYFNRAAKPISRFSQETLKDFDLIVIDADSYADLGNSSRNALNVSIREHGVGLFVQPNASYFKRSGQRSVLKFKGDSQKQFTFGEPPVSLEKYPFAFDGGFPTQPIKLDSVEVAAYAPMVNGKIATTLMMNSYQLLLEGHKGLYSQLWTRILNVVSRKKEVKAKWEEISETPRVDVPFQFKLRTPLKKPRITYEDALIPLIQDEQIPTLWHGVAYPRISGWNRFESHTDSLVGHHFYVFDTTMRQFIASQKTKEANLLQFGTNNVGDVHIVSNAKKTEPISTIWFFVVFVLCMGWLWLEPKLAY